MSGTKKSDRDPGQDSPDLQTQTALRICEASSALVCHGQHARFLSPSTARVLLSFPPNTHSPSSWALGFASLLHPQSCFPEGRVILSSLSHPAPRLFLAQDTFCITTDAMGTECHSCAHLHCSAPLSHHPSWPHCPLPASSDKDHAKGNHGLRRSKGSKLRELLFSVEKAGAFRRTSCRLEQEPRERMVKGKKRSKEQKHESPFTQST